MAEEPREKPRLISSQAPGGPKVYYNQPVAEIDDEVDEEFEEAYLDEDEIQPQPQSARRSCRRPNLGLPV